MYKGIPGDVAMCMIMVMIMMFATPWIDCYDLKCPEKPHRKIRANWLCHLMEENYSCMLDLQQTIFKESCSFASDFVRPGQKYVISGRRKNMNCSKERYQPFRLYSSELSTCAFEKSSCSAEGQIIFLEGSTKVDRTCRCDYSRGYTFLSRPKDLCYCTPNEADCSCYIAACPESRSLSTDYECKADFQSLGICKPIEKNGIEHPFDTTAGRTEFVKSSIRRKERNITSIKLILLITVMLVSFCCILIVMDTNKDTTQTATTSSSYKEVQCHKKRKVILQMLENLESILKMEEFNNDMKDTFWNDLQEILTITYPNASYNCILQCAKRDLARNDSAIIVTGETSAGKTTVIQRLVGQKLYHTKNLATVPTVCRIRNSKQMVLKAYRKDCGERTTLYDDKTFENLKQMKGAIQRLTDNCQEDGKINDTVLYTDISFPVPILKENVIIVDTPGFEESTDLDDILIDLLPEAVLLMFVVNARGIHTERMSRFLNTVLRNTENMIWFDPSDGFFLTYDVYDDSGNEILEELKKHWPTVKEDRIFNIKSSQFGSTEENFYIKDFERFEECLREFIFRNHNKQVESYVSFILNLTDNAIKLLDDIKHEKDKLIKQDSEKITELEDNKDKYIENLHSHKQTLLDDIASFLLDYLHSTTAHDEILNPKDKPSIVKIDFDEIETELRYRLQNTIKKYFHGRIVEDKMNIENENIRLTCEKIPLKIKRVEIYKTEISFELPLEEITCSYGMVEYKRSLQVEFLEMYSMYAVTGYNRFKYRLLGEKKRLKKAEKRLTYMIRNIKKNKLKTFAERIIGKDYENDVVSIFKDIILEIDRMKANTKTMKEECDSLNSKCSSIRTLHNMLQNLKL